MTTQSIDFKVEAEEEAESCRGNISIRVPKALEVAFYKIPKKARNKFMRTIIEIFVKENTNQNPIS